jgi:transaldolase
MAPRTGASEASIAMSSRLHQLSAFGQSVWIDYLSRDLIESGALAKAVAEDAVVGVTSNPSIFEQALPYGHAYDEQLGASDADARRSSSNWRGVTSPPPRRSPTRLEPDARRRRLRVDRGRPEPGRRHRGHDRWGALAARGASAQRCLWASTSVKDPSLRDTLYVEELIGAETISTMPQETIRAFQDHGRVEPRLDADLDEGRYLFNELADAGIDYDDVTATLEREGIEKFVGSFDELLQRVSDKRRHVTDAA